MASRRHREEGERRRDRERVHEGEQETHTVKNGSTRESESGIQSEGESEHERGQTPTHTHTTHTDSHLRFGRIAHQERKRNVLPCIEPVVEGECHRPICKTEHAAHVGTGTGIDLQGHYLAVFEAHAVKSIDDDLGVALLKRLVVLTCVVEGPGVVLHRPAEGYVAADHDGYFVQGPRPRRALPNVGSDEASRQRRQNRPGSFSHRCKRFQAAHAHKPHFDHRRGSQCGP